MAKDKLIIISLDAVSNDDLAILAECPTFRSLSEGGTLVCDVKPVFLSNTYPIHTSIITGCQPDKHGIRDNLLPVPGEASPDWNWYSRAIKVPTLYQKAEAMGLVTASLFWPVTAGASIKYNIPEILPTKLWHNQIILSLLNGSPWLSLRSVFRFGKNLNGAGQPELDDFSCTVLCDIIKRKAPDLMMIHFTDADTQKHLYGAASGEAKAAIRRMDDRLAQLLSALESAGELDRCHIIVLSDHGMTDVKKTINPNRYLEKLGLLSYKQNGNLRFWKAWIKCCGGSGFLYVKDSGDQETVALVREHISALTADPDSGIAGILNQEEFTRSGFDQESAFGIIPSDGIEFMEYPDHGHKANHGYSLKDNTYNTFYLLSGPLINKHVRLTGGSLLDIAPLAATLLNIPLWDMDGELRSNLLMKGRTT